MLIFSCLSETSCPSFPSNVIIPLYFPCLNHYLGYMLGLKHKYLNVSLPCYQGTLKNWDLHVIIYSQNIINTFKLS